MSINTPWEFYEQKKIATEMAIKYPHVLFNADCGGMRTSMSQAKKMKAAGHKAGFPDLFIAEPRGTYHGLFIELKLDANVYHGKTYPSKDQLWWQAELNKRGYKSEIAHGANDAIKKIETYLKGVIKCSEN